MPNTAGRHPTQAKYYLLINNNNNTHKKNKHRLLLTTIILNLKINKMAVNTKQKSAHAMTGSLEGTMHLIAGAWKLHTPPHKHPANHQKYTSRLQPPTMQAAAKAEVALNPYCNPTP